MHRLSAPAIIMLLTAGAAWAADTPAAPATPAKPYPFDTCIVSGEKLDTMGGAVVVVKDGQEVKFCCKGCIKTFEKDSAKYLKKIADAPAKADAKAEAKPAQPAH